jgi:hypothetical protein
MRIRDIPLVAGMAAVMPKTSVGVDIFLVDSKVLKQSGSDVLGDSRTVVVVATASRTCVSSKALAVIAPQS